MKISPGQSDFLNISRWFAAWLVVAEHARSLIFQDFTQIGGSNPAIKFFYFLTGFGHEAVMVFFVISGFLVGGQVWARMRSRRFEWRRYLCDRISRLYSVYVVALIIGWVLDSLGSRFFNGYGIYTDAIPEPIAVITRSFVQDLTPAAFIGNLAFLQTIVVPTFGSNGPLWSLANEWWYYLLFPAFAGVIFSRNSLRWFALAVALVAAVVLPRSIAILFVVWLMGTAASALPVRLLPWWCAGPLFFAALVIARLEIFKVQYADQFLLGITFALLLNSVSGLNRKLPVAETSRRFADFSYTAYLLHFPMLVFALSAIFSLTGFGLRMEPESATFVFYLVIVALVLGIAYLVSLATEQRTPRIREWLYRFVGVKNIVRTVNVAALGTEGKSAASR